MSYQEYLSDFIKKYREYVVSLSDFEFGDTVGKGGFGEVRRAIQSSTGKECAVKTIFNERLEGSKLRRYIGEIETMIHCNNMFLLPFVGFTPEPPYAIVTEFMPNGSLDRYVRDKTGIKLSGKQLTAIAMGIAFGMIHLHQKGIIHRDLKAANIMLDSRLFPRIGDFGIARFEEVEGMTAKIGTPNYMAPELIVTHEYDQKVDVYSYGMILYEMTQGIRPFKSYKMNEIFTMVLKKNKRPEFVKKVPDALRKLIEKCWSTEPSSRPSFEEIFERFRSGEVFFEHTRRSDIEKFLEIIGITEKRNMFYKRKVTEYSYDSYSLEGFTDTDPKLKHFSLYTETSEEEYEEEDYYESQFSSAHIDPRSQEFPKHIELDVLEVTASTFLKFYKPLGKYLTRKLPIPSIKAIISGCLSLMRRDGSFIPLLNQVQFFVNLPSGNSAVLDQIVECYAELFIKFPKLISRQHLSLISDLVGKKPTEMLILHSYYVKDLLMFSNPWPLLDNLLTLQKVLLNKPSGYMYLAIFNHLITSYESYAKERAVHVRGIFIFFLSSKVEENVRTAYDGLCQLYSDYSGIDFKRLASHLMNPNISSAALSLLMRINVPPASDELVNSLLQLTSTTPKAWIPILRISRGESGSRYLVNNLNWLEQAKRHPSDVCRLFLSLFCNESARKNLCENKYFVSFLCSLLGQDDIRLHGAASTILRRSPLTQALIDELTRSGFIRNYIQDAEKNKKNKMMHNVLMLFDALGRAGYSKDFDVLIPVLKLMLEQNGDNAVDVLTVIVTLSYHKNCALKMIKNGFKELFTELSSYDKYNTLAASFLSNVVNL